MVRAHRRGADGGAGQVRQALLFAQRHGAVHRHPFAPEADGGGNAVHHHERGGRRVRGDRERLPRDLRNQVGERRIPARQKGVRDSDGGLLQREKRRARPRYRGYRHQHPRCGVSARIEGDRNVRFRGQGMPRRNARENRRKAVGAVPLLCGKYPAEGVLCGVQAAFLCGWQTG